MGDFTAETALALQSHGIPPTIGEVIEQIVDRGWTYWIELVYTDDGPTHLASIMQTKHGIVTTIGRGESVDHMEAIAGALVMILDERRPIVARAVETDTLANPEPTRIPFMATWPYL